MIAPGAFDLLQQRIEQTMFDAKAHEKMALSLGLTRTALDLQAATQALHDALNRARGERYEAQPRNPITIDFVLGPVSKQ